MDRSENYKVICQGGLNSNENHLKLSDESDGSATQLINFEPSLYGGYRRMNGFTEFDSNFPNVGDHTTNANTATGKVLGLVYYKNEGIDNPYLIAARKDNGANTYSFWYHTPLIGWRKFNHSSYTALTWNTTNGSYTVDQVRSVQFDLGNGPMICFVDGINPATIFDGTSWYQLKVNQGGSPAAGTAASPGGDQIVDAPSVVEIFENHLFLAGDRTAQSVICHSAGKDIFNFNDSAGGGQVFGGFKVVNIKPFRDNLFVFGENAIRKISVQNSNFTAENVTSNVGCVARDSVVEIGGDLMFLAPDGFRPVSGTSRIGDIELETISKPIQGLIIDAIQNEDLSTLTAVVVRSKSQVRFFYGDSTRSVGGSVGLVGGLVQAGTSISWEFGQIQGIRASCCTSEYVNLEEFVLHGDHNGKVYRQDVGNTFDGSNILAIYSTPYLELTDTVDRKTIRGVDTFIKAEGPLEMGILVNYDWGDIGAAIPTSYSGLEGGGTPTNYNDAGLNYGASNRVYGSTSSPVISTPIEGSCKALRLTYVSTGNHNPFTVQGIVIKFSNSGRR